MPTTISLWPGSFTAPDRTELHFLLDGLRRNPGPVAEAMLSSITVEILDEDLKTPLPGPFLLMEGFVDFARNLLSEFPEFIYFADHRNRFLADCVLAVSGDCRVVESPEGITIKPMDPVAFARTVSTQIEFFISFCGSRTGVGDFVRDVHVTHLTEYLHLTVQ